jgi:hypothetical protein
MQWALHQLASILPPPGADVEDHIAELAAGQIFTLPAAQTAADALSFISQQIGKIL